MLPNGLAVWCKERPSTGSVVLRLVVRVGDRVVDDSVANRMSALQESLRR